MKTRYRTDRIVIHHSASARDVRLEDIRLWHKARGFEEVGYHFVLESDGQVRRGRGIHYIGAHALGANEDSIGICLCGDNTKPERAWTSSQIIALRQLVQTLQDVFGPLGIYGHRDVGETATECPGLEIQFVL